MTAYLGLDAGGTRTTAIAADAALGVLARAEAGPGAVRPGRAAAAAAAIYAAGRDALQRARLRAPVAAMVVGASGTAHPAEHDALAAALEGCGLAARLVVTTDAEIALAAAFGDGPGIVLIAGTGSVGWARLPDGRVARAGGLGPVLGDRGSGYDIGREALRTVGADLEMGLRLPLTARLLTHLGLEAGDLPRWSLTVGVPEIAALAPVVLDAAKDGDGVARAIVTLAARQVAALAAELARGSGPKVRIALGGGLLTARGDYRILVVESVQEFLPGAEVQRDRLDAAAGAVWLAAKLAE